MRYIEAITARPDNARLRPSAAAQAIHSIKTSSRCSPLRANCRCGNPPDRQSDENENDDVADRHVLLLEESRVLEPALPTWPAQYEEPTGGSAEKTGIDQRIQQLLTVTWLQAPESLSLVERQAESGHLEKFSLHPPNEAIVD
jgi:hypothetical protein